jgi:hypothetical protein
LTVEFRYSIWLSRFSSFFRLIDAGQHIEFLLEVTGKIFRIIKANHIGDLRNIMAAVLQQLGGFL